MTRYLRPTDGVPLSVVPQLESWDRAGSPSQVRLSGFLTYLDTVAAPLIAQTAGPLVIELVVGLPLQVPLTSGGRDLDNYLHPIAQRFGPRRIAAVFGRKIHGSSWLGIGPAQPDPSPTAPWVTAHLSGSAEQVRWKSSLRNQLLQAKVRPAPPGPVAMDIVFITGPGRTWPNLWKPVIDAFGPVLGEDPGRLFHPHDDRITALGLHHQVRSHLGHDVVIEASWAGVTGYRP